MRRRALLMGGKGKLPLVLEIDTTKPGVTPSNGFQIPASAPGETYSYKVDWGDGTVTSGHTGVASHTYAIGGIYQVKIYGKFPRMYFNNGGDRQKLLKVLDWGEINYSTNQSNAFYGCVNLDFIATDTLNAWYNNIVFGDSMFRSNSLAFLPDGMMLSSLTSGVSMFNGNSLTSLPDGMTLDSLITGGSMFNGNNLTSLPDGMALANLTGGGSMFSGNSLTSLPDGMVLANLTNGNQMFYNNNLTSLPDGMTLANLTTGNQMFYNNNLTSLPDGMTLANLTNGNQMFYNNNLTSLPDGMTLASLTTGSSMFNGNNLTSLPDGMTLASLTTGTYMFAYNNSLTELPDSITLETLESGEGMFRATPLTKADYIELHNIQGNANLFMNVANLPNYSEILIDIEANNPNDDVTIHFGSSKYNATAVTARANLVARGWTITDGGLE